MNRRKNDIDDEEDLLIHSKRSFTDHVVDYMKKTNQCLIPCPAEYEVPVSKLSRKKPLDSQGKRGSICIGYSVATVEHTKQSILTLHVIRARQLSISHPVDHQSLKTFVQITLPHHYEQTSQVIHGTNSPVYDEKFTIPLTDSHFSSPSKRLTISVYHQLSSSKSDLIGCMSFNMKTLLKTTSKTSSKCKWYCLLPESIGRHKRMALNMEVSSHPSKTRHSNGLLLNVDIAHRDEIHFSAGYPCTVSEVKTGSLGCSTTRPMPGDILLQVNEINVSRTQAKAVNKLMKTLPLPITVQLYRRSVSSSNKIALNSVDQHQPLNSKMFVKSSFNTHYADRAFCSSDRPSSTNYEALVLPSESLLMSPIPRRQTRSPSDGSESGVGSESTPYSDVEIISPSYEREALRLIAIENEFISQLELGVQFYSRPLKHYLISSSEHGKLFQNIEKILAISRYQLNRLQSLSERTIVTHLGQIFHEKVQLICEAFTRYLSGHAEACGQLKQLMKCASFERFIQANQSSLSIEQFLQIPLNHLENLAKQLDVLCSTCSNANDANYLLHVLKELRQCLAFQDASSSSASQHHCTTTMTLNSASGLTSSSVNEDEQILDLQTRLHSSRTNQSIVLTGRNRHVIFSGVLLLQTENKTYIETWAILLNDMLLFTQRNATDTRLTLICEPIPLLEIVDFRSSAEREDALIFLSTKPTVPLKIRYPSQCLQCAWQTILEQRLKTWQRSIHDESSSADSDLE